MKLAECFSHAFKVRHVVFVFEAFRVSRLHARQVVDFDPSGFLFPVIRLITRAQALHKRALLP